MGDKEKIQLSEKAKISILNFMLETAFPRILAEQNVINSKSCPPTSPAYIYNKGEDSGEHQTSRSDYPLCR